MSETSIKIFTEKGTKSVFPSLNTSIFRCQNVHINKLEQMSKPQDMKKLAKTVEFELERKKNEKLKNHEFLNQGKSMLPL